MKTDKVTVMALDKPSGQRTEWNAEGQLWSSYSILCEFWGVTFRWTNDNKEGEKRGKFQLQLIIWYLNHIGYETAAA